MTLYLAVVAWMILTGIILTAWAALTGPLNCPLTYQGLGWLMTANIALTLTKWT